MRGHGTPVTFALLVLAEGDTGRTVYGVFRGVLRRRTPTSAGFIGLGKDLARVGTVEHAWGDAPADYLAMARRFEAPGWPAFAWESGWPQRMAASEIEGRVPR